MARETWAKKAGVLRGSLIKKQPDLLPQVVIAAHATLRAGDEERRHDRSNWLWNQFPDTLLTRPRIIQYAPVYVRPGEDGKSWIKKVRAGRQRAIIHFV